MSDLSESSAVSGNGSTLSTATAPESVIVDQTCPSESDPSGNVLSKKKLKRLAKQAQWEEKKKLKRQLQKNKRKESGKPNRCKGGGKRRRRFKKMKDSTCKLHIVVDLSFDELMIEKDLIRTANQINRCYSVNRALVNPTQFHVTSFDGLSKQAMAKQVGFDNWDVIFHEKPYDEVFDKSKLVYLTSDSRNVLNELDQDKVYVIGGLVDHNGKKGLCHQLAVEKGISHARLPLQEYIDMKTRCVLSINQVFAILGHVSQGKAWQEAIMDAIPQRKNAQLREGQDSSDDENEQEQ